MFFARLPVDIADLINTARTADNFEDSLLLGLDAARRTRQWAPRQPHDDRIKTVRLALSDAAEKAIAESIEFFRLSRREVLVAAVEHAISFRDGNAFVGAKSDARPANRGQALA